MVYKQTKKRPSHFWGVLLVGWVNGLPINLGFWGTSTKTAASLLDQNHLPKVTAASLKKFMLFFE